MGAPKPLTDREQLKFNAGKCITHSCRSLHMKKQKHCARCKRALDKIRNPYGYIYQYVKQNARRRKRPFTLTLSYFKQWCIDNNYIELKGRYKDSMTIDCIIEELGYADGNLQIMTNSNNLKKRWVKYWRDKEDREVPEDYVPPPIEPQQATPAVEEIAPF